MTCAPESYQPLEGESDEAPPDGLALMDTWYCCTQFTFSEMGEFTVKEKGLLFEPSVPLHVENTTREPLPAE